MNKIMIALLLTVPMLSYANLGIEDTVSETAAKTQASNLGISQIYDHPADVSNGQYVVPVVYNRTTAEGNGTETQAGDAKPNDVDYVPLSQLKGLNGTNGTAGVAGVNGAAGAKGNTGTTGAKGDKGDQGVQGPQGTSADVPAIDPRLNVKIREFDSKHWSISSFASFGMQSGTSRYIVGQELELKLGKSYEEKRIDALERKLMR